MKRIQTILAVLLLGLTSLGAQAQRADDLAVDGRTSAQEQRQQRGARAGGPTLRDVNQAARGGDIAKARTMIDEIVQRQPDNARAHFVKAQLAARDRDVATARTELQTAERLAPGLPFAREEAVTKLRTRMERMEAREARGGQQRAGRNARDRNTTRPGEAPTQGPASTANDATANTTTAGNTSPPPVETRPAGEDTRNMGAPAPAGTADKGSNSLVMGALIGGGIVAVLAVLLFRRRRTTA
ncbi:hypothetical protein WG902_06950 [Ramlibacter sp. PS3R-8]|uniref:tetratricopeptide repeat protein n=1 Tax=Ramlibacter sp. PS3R-8 TaxID=3133437 RepID=UPI0030AA860B